MATNSTIEWTKRTWNPLVGCTMISPGCAKCYALGMSRRLAGMARKGNVTDRRRHYRDVIGPDGRWNDRIAIVDEAMSDPLKLKEPSLIFVNSMSDLFHDEVPVDFIKRVFDVMAKAHWHKFQVLTKRSERLEMLAPELNWAPNIWQGVSIENDKYVYRADHLRRIGAAIKFLSVEPLLGSVPSLSVEGLHWVIAGGESGPGARPMKPEWVREVRDKCVTADVSFFFKQWGDIRFNPDPTDSTAKVNGGVSKGGRILDGRLWDEMPYLQY